MKIYMIKIVVIMLILVGSISSCKNDDIDMTKIDFSNIEDLHAQPLPVIQKCVEGEWKWILITFSGVWGGGTLNNTFVNITKNEVVVEQDSCDLVELNMTFTYNWKEKKTLSNYTSYVMWNNEQHSGEWYFDKIQNDTLYVYSYNANSMGYSNLSLFLRIK